MRTLIYYFTGTGNSLAVARDIANRMGAELVPIVAIEDGERIRTDADRIGFVFPVYHHGVPVAVRRIVERMEGLEACPVFAVCTYGDNPGIALRRFAEILKDAGGRLFRGYEVRMPYNYIIPSLTVKGFPKMFRLRETPLAEQKEMFWIWEGKRDRIVQELEHMEEGGAETKMQAVLGVAMRMDFRHAVQKSVWLKAAGYKGRKPATFDEGVALMDHGFWSDEKCTGCGTCSRVCPVGNVTMEAGRPKWNHRCEQCFACLHWCPQESVQFREAALDRSRYHHPEVVLLDILSRLQLAEVEFGIGEEEEA